jgi:hypothetical protein
VQGDTRGLRRVDFFVAGVQKGGTTALDSVLRTHPDITMATVKEVHHFDDENLDWDDPDHARWHAAFPDATWTTGPEAGLLGEATPIYTYWPQAMTRIRRYNPSARIIVGLRHPSFRAWSHWRMVHSWNADTMAFGDAIRKPGRERVHLSPGGVHRVWSYVERGFYAGQVQSLLDAFPRHQVCFYRTDQLWTRPQEVLDRIQGFLGLPRKVLAPPAYVVPTNSWRPGGLPAVDRALLDDLYRDTVRATARLTGIDLDDWLDPAYAEPMRPPA